MTYTGRRHYVVVGRRMVRDQERGGWKLDDATWVLWSSPRQAAGPAAAWVQRECFRSADTGRVWMGPELFGAVHVSSMEELGSVHLLGDVFRRAS